MSSGIETIRGQNYVFYFNDGTQLGEVHVGQYKIPLAEGDALQFKAADEQARVGLLQRYANAQAAYLAARKGKRA